MNGWRGIGACWRKEDAAAAAARTARANRAKGVVGEGGVAEGERPGGGEEADERQGDGETRGLLGRRVAARGIGGEADKAARPDITDHRRSPIPAAGELLHFRGALTRLLFTVDIPCPTAHAFPAPLWFPHLSPSAPRPPPPPRLLSHWHHHQIPCTLINLSLGSVPAPRLSLSQPCAILAAGSFTKERCRHSSLAADDVPVLAVFSPPLWLSPCRPLPFGCRAGFRRGQNEL